MKREHEFKCMVGGCEVKTECREEMEEHEKNIHSWLNSMLRRIRGLICI